jgi:hypothetical protein
MAVFNKKSDADIVASVRLRQRIRRPVGVFLMCLGMCAFVATVRTVHAFKETLTHAVELVEHRRENGISSGRVSDIFVATHEAAYRSGKSLAYGTLLGLLMFTLGLAYAVGSKREDELLLRYVERVDAPTSGA